jgi:uncharacterized Fe-S radical SAM superfamily protein PflX
MLCDWPYFEICICLFLKVWNIFQYMNIERLKFKLHVVQIYIGDMEYV